MKNENAIILFLHNFIFLGVFQLKSQPKSKRSDQISISILTRIGMLFVNIAVANLLGATACLPLYGRRYIIRILKKIGGTMYNRLTARQNAIRDAKNNLPGRGDPQFSSFEKELMAMARNEARQITSSYAPQLEVLNGRYKPLL
ncbi:MAG TPA: hypothetical protein VF369_05910, partial [candidate division Zixibacteria bacterium]